MTMPPPVLSSRKRALLHGVTSLLLLSIQLPMLARAPQNPDGAEMIMASLSGGILHPPGYPLQAWLDRIFILLPWGPHAVRLALLSSLSSIVAANVLLAILLSEGLPWAASVFAMATFCFFPTSWYLFVQPEKYGLTTLFFLLFVWQFLCFSRKPRLTKADGVAWGVVTGLAFAQHPVSVLMAPFFVSSFFLLLRDPKGRMGRTGVALFSVVGVAVSLYFSLFLLTTPNAWPDWGKIQTISDLVNLVLRRDFHLLQPKTSSTEGVNLSALTVFIHRYWATFKVVGILPLLGWIRLIQKNRWGLAMGFAAVAILNLIFLRTAELGPSGFVAEAYLERYHVPFVSALAILFGFGCEWLLNLAGTKIAPILRGALVIASICLAFLSYDTADASSDSTCDLYRDGLALSADPKAIFIAGNDLDLFYGIPTKEGVRFPVTGEYPWSVARAVPLIERRLKLFDLDSVHNAKQLVGYAYARGFSIMISNPGLLSGAPTPIVQKGLFWFAARSMKDAQSEDTLRAALKLCPLLENLSSPRPTQSFLYGRYLFSAFPLAFKSAAEYLSSKGDVEGNEMSHEIQIALEDGSTPLRWIAGCQALRARYPF